MIFGILLLLWSPIISILIIRTYKNLEKGTRQGLEIRYDIIVYKHSGFIEIDSIRHKTTNYVLGLPLNNSEYNEEA